jgi:hypothetical protein
VLQRELEPPPTWTSEAAVAPFRFGSKCECEYVCKVYTRSCTSGHLRHGLKGPSKRGKLGILAASAASASSDSDTTCAGTRRYRRLRANNDARP